MDTTSQYIDKEQVLPPGQDFARLRKEGIDRLQQLSGDLWTDYNDHDPGVTLLEALCFALTDLDHRAGQPMPTMLAPNPAREDAPASTLLPPHEAFANHPVTLADYKKLILDQFYGKLKNVWLGPLLGAHGQPVAPGHYQVAIELLPASVLPVTVPLSGGEQKRLRAAVLATLNRHRNLGEVFVQAVVLRPRPLTLQGHLDLVLNPGQQPEDLLAQALETMATNLDPAPLAPDLTYLSEQLGMAVEDIFAGPIPHHRLLMEASFQPQRVAIDVDELLRPLAEIPGIRLVGSLAFYAEHQGATNAVACKPNEILTFDVEGSLARFGLSQNGAPLMFDRTRALREFYRLQQQRDKSIINALRADQLRFPEPAGTYRDLGHYDSVQHLLPTLYGTGEGGAPAPVRPAQQAYIMQLKGYLLFFEQLMADFCAQLENAGRFFSPTPQATAHFRAPLYNVPHVAPLLPGSGVSAAETWGYDAAAAARWQAYQANPDNPYQQSLQQLPDPLADQRQRRDFLTHLLARFGYSIHLHLPARVDVGQVNAYTIQAYEQLLTHLNRAAYHRGAARLPVAGQVQPTEYAESGLEFFLFLLTGLESIPRKLARQESLAALAAQVQLDSEQPTGPSTGPSPALAVRGQHLSFSQWLDVAWELLRAPRLELVSETMVRFTSTSKQIVEVIDIEVLIEIPPPAPGPPTHAGHHLHRHLHHLDKRLERFGLIDHLVLKPLHELTTPAPEPAAHDFFHCQATVLLPGYSLQFHTGSSAAQAAEATSARAYVEQLIRQYAPAHLLVNPVWLGYEAMREWEALYAKLHQASGFLNASGTADPELLGPAQAQARHFVHTHLAGNSPRS